MRRLAACLLALALAACGGDPFPVGAAKGWVQPAPVLQPGEVIVSQPDTVPTYNDRVPPRNTVGITLWGPYETLPSPPTDATSGGGAAAITIDSASIPRNVADQMGKGTIVMGVNLDPGDQALAEGKRYHHSFDLRVTNAWGNGGAVAHVVAYVGLRHRTSGQHLYIGRIVYDTRCGRSGDVVKWDRGTNRPFANTVDPAYVCRPHNDWRTYGFVVGQQEIARVASLINGRFGLGLSSRAADYTLENVVLNPELHVVPGITNARIDLSVKNWKVEIVR